MFLRPSVVGVTLITLMLAACATASAASSGAPVQIPTATAQTRILHVTVQIPTVTSIIPTGTPAATSAPNFTPQTLEALPTPTPTCAETTGTVLDEQIPSVVLRYGIDSKIYLPPCYETSTRHYPVLYLFHGLDFKQDQWERIGVFTATNELIASGDIGPVIIVLPRDRRDDRLDKAFVEDLVPYIDTNYRTLADWKYRAIGGLSRGGGWAVHIGLKYPKTFSKIGTHSPAVFIGDEYDIIEWTKKLKPGEKPTVYIDIGDGDSLQNSAFWLNQIFGWFKVPYTYTVQSGAHIEKYWSQHVRDYMLFYAGDWKDVPETIPPPEEDDQLTP